MGYEDSIVLKKGTLEVAKEDNGQGRISESVGKEALEKTENEFLPERKGLNKKLIPSYPLHPAHLAGVHCAAKEGLCCSHSPFF